VSWRGARTHFGGNTPTRPNPGRAASGLDDACRHLELILSMTERASSEVTLPPFQESGNALNHSKKPFANTVKFHSSEPAGEPLYRSQMGPKQQICVKTEDSSTPYSCYQPRKQASRRTIYASSERTKPWQITHSSRSGDECRWIEGMSGRVVKYGKG